VDVLCQTDSNELWLIEFQMYDDEYMFERNLTEISYAIIRSAAAGTTAGEMAEAMPHIVVINFLNFYVRGEDSEWLQPVHFTYDKEPREVANGKLEIFNVQLPWFGSRLPDFGDDGECWLYVMYQSHIRGITPQEVIEMDARLTKFAESNPGFQQFETRFRQAIADPDLLDILRMEASERIRQAGMKKAAERIGEERGMKKGLEKGMKKGIKEGIKEGMKEGMKEGLEKGLEKGMKEGTKATARATAQRMLRDKLPLDKVATYSGLSLDEVRALQAE
jgi:hypothetical protein